jgi:nicotinamidase-related amidase
MHTAFLVIDVQQGLCEGKHAAFEADDVIARINRVSARARAAGVPVIFIQHATPTGRLVNGSAGWQLAQGLVKTPDDLRVRKTTPDAFNGTELAAILAARGIADLVIGGMHTEFCVDTTVRRALSLGFPVVLVADGHTSAGNRHLTAPQIIAHHNETLSNITSFGPRVRPVRAADIVFGNSDGEKA